MKIDFKDKRIGLPIIIVLGAIFFSIVIYLNYFQDDEVVVVEDETEVLKSSVADVSNTEAEKELDNKFAAYDTQVNEQREKYTAIQGIRMERTNQAESIYTDEEKDALDIEQSKLAAQREREALEANKNKRNKKRYQGDDGLDDGGYKSISNNDNSEQDEFEQLVKAMQETNNNMAQPVDDVQQPSPFDEMKKQMLFLDSLEKANDPNLQAQMKAEIRDRMMFERMEQNKLSRLEVQKLSYNKAFNSIHRKTEGEFIKAIVDEDRTGYMGSRLRIRLLEDIKIGNQILRKNNYLYAIITGFQEQRVIFTISSIMYENQILPIKLKVYDNDGLEGLYVPASQFREFTKEVGESGMQSLGSQQIGGTENQQEFYMSMISRMFQSTSTAITKMLRKNKVKTKYGTFIYLVDDKALEATKKRIYEINKQNQEER